MKIYLVPFDEHKVKFSFDKTQLEEVVKKELGIPYAGILELEIENSLAEQLHHPAQLESPYVRAIPQDYYSSREKFLNNPPEWHQKEGMRLYVIFDKLQRCYWSPSGNNLNSFYDRHPEKCLSRPLRVELNKDAYVKLMGYFMCMAEIF